MDDGAEEIPVGVAKRDDGAEVPHAPVAVTDMVPGVVPTVAVMDADEETPLHPAGRLQLYVVPPTAATLYV